jgi:hypothetical protein
MYIFAARTTELDEQEMHPSMPYISQKAAHVA